MTPVIKLAFFLSIICVCYSAPCIGKDCDSHKSGKDTGTVVNFGLNGKSGSDSCGDDKNNLNSIESQNVGQGTGGVVTAEITLENLGKHSDDGKSGSDKTDVSKATADLHQAKKELEKASDQAKAANAAQSKAKIQLQSAKKANDDAKKHVKSALKEKKKAESEVKSAEKALKKVKENEKNKEKSINVVTGASNINIDGSLDNESSHGISFSSSSASADVIGSTDNGSCDIGASSDIAAASGSAAVAATVTASSAASSSHGSDKSC